MQAFMQGRFSVNGNPYIAGILAGLFCALVHFLFRKMKIAGATILLAASVFAGLAVCTVLNNNGSIERLQKICGAAGCGGNRKEG